MSQTSDSHLTDNAGEPMVVEMFRFNVWANLRLLDGCAQLKPEHLKAGAPGTFGDVYSTLKHIVNAEEWYIELLTGQRLAQGTPTNKPPSLPEVRARAVRSGERLLELARSLPPAQQARWQEDGEDVSVTTAQLLTQAINHAIEHRTHVTTILSQQGIKPPWISEWARLSERGGDAAPRAFTLYAD